MKRQLCTFLFSLLWLTACAAPATPVPTITPFPTRVLPTATATRPPSVLEGTPVSLPQTAIGIDQLDRLVPVARWGKGSVVQVTISPQGGLSAVATPGGVYIYDSESFEETQFIESKSWLSSMAFSPDGTLLALGSLDGSIQVLQLPDGTKRNTFGSPLGSITSLTFSTTGSLLAAGDARGHHPNTAG